MNQRQTLANALRILAIDAVQAAQSGHPGMPMGMADIAEVLWNGFLRHNPANPQWPDRDRFVVSNGHGSMLLYGLLHLSGYALPMEEIKRFRQLHSKTPGHPEYGITPGVETTTGPLGQGLANAVGMALGEKLLADEFNRPRHTIVDHFTYVFLGDGCLMEGISHEACSLAGTLKLGKLICFYDDNGISIDGHVEHWFGDDTPKRFEAYGWQVLSVDGHNAHSLFEAIARARAATAQPTLICCKTVIGKGSPHKAGTHEIHGAALGEKEVAATRQALLWQYPPFHVPEEVRQFWDARERGGQLERAWRERLGAYRAAYPALADEFERRMAGQLPQQWQAAVAEVEQAVAANGDSIATRKASQHAIEALAPLLPELVGGSADLTGSNLTDWSGTQAVRAGQPGGNYVNYGVREFGMSAVMNGMALHGGLIPYGGTFLTFSDYSRNALRMAALMRIRSIFVFTHDSIGLGEDGPTHQAVEHVTGLRIIPNLHVWRPCDTSETTAAWIASLERRDGPSALVLSRQNLPFQPRSGEQVAAIRRGGYVLSEAGGPLQAILIATGSEVMFAMQAQRELAQRQIHVRVVSMPCTREFDLQSTDYRRQVLVPEVPKVAIEAGVPDFWIKYVGDGGRVIGIDRYGESAPAAELYQYFGITAQALCSAVNDLI
jgi:transketolase